MIKKIFKIILLMLSIAGLISLYSYAKNNIHIGDEGKIIFGEAPQHKSDNMLLDDGEYMIALNKINAESYLATTAITSPFDISDLYKSLIPIVSEQENIVIGDTLQVYLNCMSDIDMEMYIIGEFKFESSSLVNVFFKWYDGKSIFSFNNKSFNLGEKDKRAYKGTSISLTNNSFIYMKSSYYDNKEKDLVDGYVSLIDLGIENEKIQKICNSIYYDLFYTCQSEKDDNKNQDIKEYCMNWVIDYINGEEDYDFTYDVEAFGCNGNVQEILKQQYEFIYSNYETLVEDEGARDCMKGLLFEYAYINKSTLAERKIYIYMDGFFSGNLSYSIMIFEDNSYKTIFSMFSDSNDCIMDDNYFFYEIYSDLSYNHTHLKIDMTNYALMYDYIEMDKYNTYLVKDMAKDEEGCYYFDNSTKKYLVAGQYDLANQFNLFR